MKDERKIFWICLMLAASIILFTVKASGQSGTFDHLLLRDQYGGEIRKQDSKITLLPGKLEITENGETWTEKILLQTKSPDTCQVETSAGYYVLVLKGERLERAYLRSNVGADRIYLAGLPGFFDTKTKD
jgi:hypothetical protein